MEYFDNLFTAGPRVDIGPIIQKIHPCVSQAMNEQLMGLFTAKEMKNAINQMGPTKSPGPDGFPALFYLKSWETVGEEFCDLVLNYLNNGVLPEEINQTRIVLIPKVNEP